MLGNLSNNVSKKPTRFKVSKAEKSQVVQDISKAHVDSFNYFIKEGLPAMIKNIYPLEIECPNNDKIKVEITGCKLGIPTIKTGAQAKTLKVYPAECRSRCVSYKSNFLLRLAWSKNGEVMEELEKIVGEIPVMVKSRACNLNTLKPEELIRHGEEENEFGGYFIINGNEKIIRMLIVQRRNYPLAMQRFSWKKRGDLFTEYGVSIRCVRNDQSGNSMVLHYLSDGSAKLMFSYKKELYFMPVMLILKALLDETDFFIFKSLILGKESDSCYQGYIKSMLRQLTKEEIFSQKQALNYIGDKFRVKSGLPSWYSNTEVAKFLLKECVCVHLNDGRDKFHLLIFMVKKLFSLVKKECALESPDNPMNCEILLPGHLYLLVIKEKLYSWLVSLRLTLERKMKLGKTETMTDVMMRHCLAHTMDMSRPVDNFLATGNFVPRLDSTLMQFSGLVVVADKLNMWRYTSHFRAVHRGALFAKMRTTSVRKLLPESWGFLCPVHTPDGASCGLLNHLSAKCQVVNSVPDTKALVPLLLKYGMLPRNDPMVPGDAYNVLLDGKVIGWVRQEEASSLVNKLRYLKSLAKEGVPPVLEIGWLPSQASQFPGLFLFSTPARMMRPVRNLLSRGIEFVGTFEQPYLHIAIQQADVQPGITVHQEVVPTCILSILANQIPYSDCNQSPRNMYSCQMGKQTMGMPCYALPYRSDNKLYFNQTPQAPIVRPKMHDFYDMDNYPLGTNAIVAVLSYTGCDMEDAIVINKSSMERGFMHGYIYKSLLVNLGTMTGERNTNLIFGRPKTDVKHNKFVDEDGLPYPGTRLNFGDPLCCYIDVTTGITEYVKYRCTEEAYVHDVKVLGNDMGTQPSQNICIKLRIPRKPIIGDKFASRHGQKGICSMLLSIEDMPFTEEGMTPDIIFNPHGFPSRMTIGMMIESMAGKAGAVDGIFHDATPFTYSEQEPAYHYFGNCLTKAGYHYYGTERLYSGISGKELEADIFFGVVYYQRLRHMVADKFQVRSTGPIDPLTHQPIKGRKSGGGIRFGEMERDALIAHGTAMSLHDRLFVCSDGSQQHICGKCMNLLAPEFVGGASSSLESTQKTWYCQICKTHKHIYVIGIPYVFRYLCSELASVNIQVQLRIGDHQSLA